MAEHKHSLWLESELALVGMALGVVLFFVVISAPKLRIVDQAQHTAHLDRRLLVLIGGAAILYLGGLAAYFLSRKTAKALGAVAVSMLALILFINVMETRVQIADSSKPDYYKGGMEWVRANVPAGETVFNTDWDDFPKMFFYDTTHKYVSGLDPTYLLDRNPDLSKLYEDITLGKQKDPGPLIRDKFGATYVFTDNEKIHDDFVNNAIDSGWFENVYEDDDCTVLKLRDVKGEPPNEDEKATDEDEGDVNSVGNEEGQ
jgi:hypothetical protein